MGKRNRAREARRTATGGAATRNGGAPGHDGGARAGASSSDLRAAANGSPRTTPAPGPTGPPAEQRRITSPAQARELAARLLDSRRRHPVVVVSVPAGRQEPWIDADEIHAAVRGYAEVVVLPTDASSWALSDALPERTQVYGGAGRVYPVGTEWVQDLQRSPLRFAYGPSDAQRATEHLISDALRMIAAVGPLSPQGPATSRRATGVVSAVIEPSRALVTLDDGTVAVIRQELTLPDVTIGQVVAPGQEVTGTLDRDARLDVRSGLRRGARSIEHYRAGDVVLARVESVRRDVVRVALHPDVVVSVARDRVTTNPSDSLTSLFSQNEVVVARVESAGVNPTLRFDDVDDEDVPLEAPALLDGGPSWLTPPDPMAWEAPDDEDALLDGQASSAPVSRAGADTDLGDEAASRDGAAAPVPRDGGAAPVPRGAVHTLSLSLDSARARITQLEVELEQALAAVRDLGDLRRRVGDLEEENRRLEKRVQDQRSQLRTEKQRAQKADRERARRSEAGGGDGTGPDPAPSGPLFLAPAEQEAYDVEQFRNEVYTEWARRIPPGDKSERPLGPYEVGPDFLGSLRTLEGISRDKVVRVVVEVLTGLAEELDGRQLHELRQGKAGNSPPVTRDGGWTCYRAALQRETPGARRLSYWRRGNEFELSRVVHHDDMNP